MLIPDVKLIENNARVGADVAIELARLQREAKHANGAQYYFTRSQSTAKAHPTSSKFRSEPVKDSPPAPKVIVFGSAALDITSQASTTLIPGTTTPGRIVLTPGGVGRNIAEAAQKLLPVSSVQLVSPIGSDMVGRVTRQEMETVALRTDGLVQIEAEEVGSAACTLNLGPAGDLEVGVADMGIVELMTDRDVSNFKSVAIRDYELNMKKRFRRPLRGRSQRW